MNKTLRNLSEQLKKMGIKNHDFMLKLNDTELEHVDVFSDNLSREMQFRIMTEVRDNFWFFAGRCLRLSVAGRLIDFRPKISGLVTLFLKLNNINHLETVPRQCGKTWNNVIWHIWLILRRESSYSEIICKDSYSRLHIQKTILDIIKNLPKYMQCCVDIFPNNINGNPFSTETNNFFCDNQRSAVLVSVPLYRKQYDISMSHGKSMATLHFDEGTYIKHLKKIYLDYLPSQNQAKKHTKYHHISIDCIVDDNIKNENRQFILDMINHAVMWDYKYFDDINILKSDMSKKGSTFVYSHFDVYDLFDDEMCKQLEKDWMNYDETGETWRKEYLCDWRSDEDNLFDMSKMKDDKPRYANNGLIL